MGSSPGKWANQFNSVVPVQGLGRVFKGREPKTTTNQSFCLPWLILHLQCQQKAHKIPLGSEEWCSHVPRGAEPATSCNWSVRPQFPTQMEPLCPLLSNTAALGGHTGLDFCVNLLWRDILMAAQTWLTYILMKNNARLLYKTKKRHSCKRLWSFFLMEKDEYHWLWRKKKVMK